MTPDLLKIHKAKKPYQQELIEACEHNLYAFATVINPAYLYGDIHREIFSWLSDPEANHRQLLLLPRGHLKALHIDAKVLTPTGWVRNGDLKIGDRVIGADGKSTLVTAVHPVSKMKLWEVRTRDGRKTICNEEHLWTLECPSNTGSKLVTKPLKDILKNYKSERFDKRTGESYTEYRYFLPTVEPIQFKEKEFLVDPYTLGAWLGDGSSAGGSITTADPEILKWIPYKSKKWASKYLYGLSGLHTDLRSIGVLKNKHIPEEYLFGSVQQRTALLQGIVDTDGTIQSDGKRFSITTKSESLKNGYVALIRSLGGTATVGTVWAAPKVGGIKKPYFSITARVPEGIIPARLSRKREQWIGSIKTKSAIVSIAPVEDDYARCITVSNEDGLYICDDYMVTHNSHCIAVFCAWKITYEPWTTIVYLASQDDLAKAQLFAIKQMMTSDIYTSLWPEMFTEQRGVKGERGTWSAFAFDVDHPCRRDRSVRDHTMQIKTVKSNAQGLHCDGLVFDDVVVPQFADTGAGRGELSRSLGYYSSILNAGGWIKAVGTRYHPEDAYQSMIDATIPQWDEEAQDFVGEIPAWDVMERVVEDSPQRLGTGRFLWPRTECPKTGRKYGFDIRELAKIKADYVSHQGLIHYFSQYYNDPNDVGTQRINRSQFQYYDPKFVTIRNDKVFFTNKKLNVYAAMDVAWSESERADYTAIAVIGIDSDGYIYILELDRFRTSDFLTYYERIQALHQRWFFRQLIVETNAAGSLVAQEVENHVRRNGDSLVVVRRAKNSRTGGKVENWAAVIEPRYHSKSVLHYTGGLTPALEEELMSAKPRHDDLKDALCAAISIAKPPSAGRSVDYKELNTRSNVVVGRFGGRARSR